MQRVKDALPHRAGLCYNLAPPVTRIPPGTRSLAGRATLMKNFLRVMRVAWGYRGRLLLSLACALFAAVLWGLMFTCIDPVLYILKNGNKANNNLPGRQEAKIAELDAKVKDLEPQLAGLVKRRD